jgi:cytosine deaminase
MTASAFGQPLPCAVRVLRNALIPGGDVVDVVLDGDIVASVRPADRRTPVAADRGELDLDGYLLLPAGADAHAHLDKAYTGRAVAFPHGDLTRAVDAWLAYAERMTESEIHARARHAAVTLLRNGTTAVRSHVDLLPGGDPLRGVRALVRVREELRDLMTLQLVTGTVDSTPTELIHAALDAGVDIVGGAPHFGADPHAEVRRLVRIARERGVGIDLHTDESLSGEVTLDTFLALVDDWPSHLSLTAGHCVRQGTLDPAHLEATITGLVRTGMSVVTLPLTNLNLQGRELGQDKPRGIAPLRAFLDGGVDLAAAGDNVEDAFNPVGRGDPLETAMLLVVAAHLSLEEAWHLASAGSRRAMRLAPAGAFPGAQADFLAVRAGGLAMAVAEAPSDRMVLSRGRLVAVSRTESAVAEPAGLRPDDDAEYS